MTGSAGTPADNYRATRAPHPWQPALADPGERPRCACGLERHEHPDRKESVR